MFVFIDRLDKDISPPDFCPRGTGHKLLNSQLTAVRPYVPNVILLVDKSPVHLELVPRDVVKGSDIPDSMTILVGITIEWSRVQPSPCFSW